MTRVSKMRGRARWTRSMRMRRRCVRLGSRAAPRCVRRFPRGSQSLLARRLCVVNLPAHLRSLAFSAHTCAAGVARALGSVRSAPCCMKWQFTNEMASSHEESRAVPSSSHAHDTARCKRRAYQLYCPLWKTGEYSLSCLTLVKFSTVQVNSPCSASSELSVLSTAQRMGPSQKKK